MSALQKTIRCLLGALLLYIAKQVIRMNDGILCDIQGSPGDHASRIDMTAPPGMQEHLH